MAHFNIPSDTSIWKQLSVYWYPCVIHYPLESKTVWNNLIQRIEIQPTAEKMTSNPMEMKSEARIGLPQHPKMLYAPLQIQRKLRFSIEPEPECGADLSGIIYGWTNKGSDPRNSKRTTTMKTIFNFYFLHSLSISSSSGY